MKYLWIVLVGICTLGFLSCGEDSTGAKNSEGIWVADLGEKGGVSITYQLDFSYEPQLLEGLYFDGTLSDGILGTYEFNAEGLAITTDKCVAEFGDALSKEHCEGLGSVESRPIFKTESGYILVRTSRIYEVTEGGESQEIIEYDTIPFQKLI